MSHSPEAEPHSVTLEVTPDDDQISVKIEEDDLPTAASATGLAPILDPQNGTLKAEETEVKVKIEDPELLALDEAIDVKDPASRARILARAAKIRGLRPFEALKHLQLECFEHEPWNRNQDPHNRIVHNANGLTMTWGDILLIGQPIAPPQPRPAFAKPSPETCIGIAYFLRDTFGIPPPPPPVRPVRFDFVEGPPSTLLDLSGINPAPATTPEVRDETTVHSNRAPLVDYESD